MAGPPIEAVCVPTTIAEDPALVTHVAPASSVSTGAAVGITYIDVFPEGYLMRRPPLGLSVATLPPERVTSAPPVVTTCVPIWTVEAPCAAETVCPPMVAIIVWLVTIPTARSRTDVVGDPMAGMTENDAGTGEGAAP